MSRTFPRFAHNHFDKRSLFDHNFELPSISLKKIDVLHDDEILDRAFRTGTSSAISSSCVPFYPRRCVQPARRGKGKNTPGMSKRTRRAVDRTSYAIREWCTPRERVSGRCARVSPSYIACVRRPAARVLPLPEQRARACPSCTSSFEASSQACGRSAFESFSRKEKNRRTCTRGTTMRILCLSIRQDARFPGLSRNRAACP